jgi:hypothetical protein
MSICVDVFATVDSTLTLRIVDIEGTFAITFVFVTVATIPILELTLMVGEIALFALDAITEVIETSPPLGLSQVDVFSLFQVLAETLDHVRVAMF